MYRTGNMNTIYTNNKREVMAAIQCLLAHPVDFQVSQNNTGTVFIDAPAEYIEACLNAAKQVPQFVEMKFTESQKQVLRIMGRSGTISLQELKRKFLHYKPVVANLIANGAVVEYLKLEGGEFVVHYALTQEVNSYMPSIMDGDYEEAV